MIFDVPFLLRHLSEHTPLLPGDLIFTGTPEGVGELRQGDTFEMRFTNDFARYKKYRGVL